MKTGNWESQRKVDFINQDGSLGFHCQQQQLLDTLVSHSNSNHSNLVYSNNDVVFEAAAPLVDMVLLSANTAVAILVSELFSITLLGEVFICKYDLPAITLIVTGTILTIL